jgi:F-type H+-transporting ATPase subunit epsilon
MQPQLMHLRVLLPFGVFADKQGVSKVIAETAEGSFGLLPRRLDCVATLVPGILTYETQGDGAEGEVYVAVNEGVLIKTGSHVLVSVRQALAGTDLAQLREAVERQFLALDQQAKEVRSAMVRLETGFMRRVASLQHG